MSFWLAETLSNWGQIMFEESFFRQTALNFQIRQFANINKYLFCTIWFLLCFCFSLHGTNSEIFLKGLSMWENVSTISTLYQFCKLINVFEFVFIPCDDVEFIFSSPELWQSVAVCAILILFALSSSTIQLSRISKIADMEDYLRSGLQSFGKYNQVILHLPEY